MLHKYDTNQGKEQKLQHLQSIVEQQLKAGENINQQDEKGDTLLHTLARHGDPGLSITETLIEQKGINPNILNKAGQSALHIAVELRAVETIQLLQQHTTDPAIWQSFVQDNAKLKNSSMEKIKKAIQGISDPYSHPILKPEYVALHILNKKWSQAYSVMLEDKQSLKDIKREHIEKNSESAWVGFTFPEFFNGLLTQKSSLGSTLVNLEEATECAKHSLLFALEHNKDFVKILFTNYDAFCALLRGFLSPSIALCILEKQLPLTHIEVLDKKTQVEIIKNAINPHFPQDTALYNECRALLPLLAQQEKFDTQFKEIRCKIVDAIDQKYPKLRQEPTRSKFGFTR